ncbi:hypothetical protein HY642_05205 [Candidatus Woesearchaeota archaeon]|nr:hypothetical protein [Candidatus Woesearchaeota archaeon]
MRSAIILAFAALFIAAGVFMAQESYYHPGKYGAIPAARHSLDITVETAQTGAAHPGAQRQAIVLVDNAHDNQADLAALFQAFATMGVKVRTVDDWSELGENRSLPNASIIIAGATTGFTEKELAIAENLTRRVLILGDVENSSARGLALRLGLHFNDDYLYNTREKDANFRNVIYRTFSPHPVTQGLREVVLYAACSIDPASAGIIVTDSNTFSSATEQPSVRAPAVAVNNVLALCDESLFKEPYASIDDNRLLIANIAEWLVSP